MAAVNGGPHTISFSGASRTHGWSRFASFLNDVNDASRVLLSPSFRGTLLALRLCDRYLRTADAVAATRPADSAGSAHSERQFHRHLQLSREVHLAGNDTETGRPRLSSR